MGPQATMHSVARRTQLQFDKFAHNAVTHSCGRPPGWWIAPAYEILKIMMNMEGREVCEKKELTSRGTLYYQS